MLYPLLLQSLAVGYGLGLGSAFRTLGKSQYSIVESLVVTAIMLPIGFWLIQTYGGLGAAWFVGLQWILNAVLGVAIVLWLARPKPTPQSLDNALG
jgi:Na+-driven multidrug efflux pump